MLVTDQSTVGRGALASGRSCHSDAHLVVCYGEKRDLWLRTIRIYPPPASCPKLALSPLTDSRPMSSALTKSIVITAEPQDRPYELRDAQVRGLIFACSPLVMKHGSSPGHTVSVVPWVRSNICDLIRPASKPGKPLLSMFSQDCLRWLSPSPLVARSKHCSTSISSLGLLLSSRAVVSTQTAFDQCARGCCAVRSSRLTCP